MDKTRPHLRRFFKVVQMVDDNGNKIPNNPPIQHGGPWVKVKGIQLGKDTAKSSHE